MFSCAVCDVLRLQGPRAVPRAARRIPRSGTPCGPNTAYPPFSSGRGHISVGLRALVNIIGRWCVKLTVPVRTPRATSPIKLSRDTPPFPPSPLYSASTIHRSDTFDGGEAIFHSFNKNKKNKFHVWDVGFYTMIHNT